MRRSSCGQICHWLGTDRLGRDVFSRIIYGARVSVSIGLIAVGVGLLIGAPLGLVAGYMGAGGTKRSCASATPGSPSRA